MWIEITEGRFINLDQVEQIKVTKEDSHFSVHFTSGESTGFTFDRIDQIAFNTMLAYIRSKK